MPPLSRMAPLISSVWLSCPTSSVAARVDSCSQHEWHGGVHGKVHMNKGMFGWYGYAWCRATSKAILYETHCATYLSALARS